MSELRTGHTATLLTDGGVLIVGPDVTAEVYSPATRIFTPVGNLPLISGFNVAAGVTGSTATLLEDGTVLIAGGHRILYQRLAQSLASAELYAPESEAFTFTGSLNRARDGHTATLLSDGAVLVTGGINHELSGMHPHEIATVLSSAELFK